MRPQQNGGDDGFVSILIDLYSFYLVLRFDVSW